MKFIIFATLLTATLSLADDIYFRNGYVYRNCFVADTMDNKIRVKITGGPDKTFPLTTIDNIVITPYDPTLDTYVVNVSQEEKDKQSAQHTQEEPVKINPEYVPESNPDGIIGRPVIIIGAESDIGSTFDTKDASNGATGAYTDMNGYGFTGALLLPTSKGVTWQFTLNYGIINNEAGIPGIQNPLLKYEGHTFRAGIFLKFYP